MSKRTTVALAFAAGCVLGGFIGFLVHAPGRSSTWTDARGWATFVVVVLGFSVAAYELNLQRRQFADEAKRNEARDDLLDRQRRELQQAERFRERLQAEQVDLAWGRDSNGGSFVRVINNSPRPVRRIACRNEPREATASLTPPDKASEMYDFSMPGGRQQWVLPPEPYPADGVVGMIKSGGRAGLDLRRCKAHRKGQPYEGPVHR